MIKTTAGGTQVAAYLVPTVPVTYGEVPGQALSALVPGLDLGLWYRSEDGSRLVATRALARLAAESLTEQEAVASVCACAPEFRTEWLSILAARLKEYGAGRNIRELISTIGKLGPASRTLRNFLSESRLRGTGFDDVELQLFGAPAEQAVVYPRLVRALSATASLT